MNNKRLMARMGNGLLREVKDSASASLNPDDAQSIMGRLFQNAECETQGGPEPAA